MLRRLLVFLLLSTSMSSGHAFAQRRRAVGAPIAAGLPRVSAEFPISDVAYGPSFGARAPRIAAGPTQALVAWEGGAVRVDAEGRPLDAIPLVQPENGKVDVAWDGSHYDIITTKFGTAAESVQLTFVETDGRVSAPIAIANMKYAVNGMAVAASGGAVLIVYATGNFDGPTNSIRGNSINAALVSGGRVVKEVQLAAYSDNGAVRAVSSPNGFLVWWSDSYAIVGREGSIAASGNNPYETMTAVWNGTEWEGIATLSSGVTMFPISAAGVMGAPVVVHSTLPAVSPAIAWNGSEYAILWKDEKIERPSVGVYSTATFDLRAGRVSADQHLLAESLVAPGLDFTDFRFIPGPAAVAIAAIGSNFIAAWSNGYNNPGPLYGMAFSAPQLPGVDDVESGRHLLSRTSLYETVSWIVADGESARLFFNNLQTEVVDDRGRRGPVTPLPGINSGARFAFNGVDTFAASAVSTAGGDSRIDGALVDQNGSIVRQFPITSLPAGTFAGPVSCNANDCATTWSDPAPVEMPATSHLQRISPAGTLIDAPVALPPGLLALSGLADQYLILMRWGNKIVATRFADGKLSDVTDVLSAAVNAGGPAVAIAGPDGWLVAVVDLDMTNYRVHLAHLDRNAVHTWQLDLRAAGDAPAMVWDGHDWVIVFTKGDDIFGARITADGRLLDGTPDAPGFPVAAQPTQEGHPFASSSGNGLIAVAYQRVTNDRIYGRSARVFVRWIDNR